MSHLSTVQRVAKNTSIIIAGNLIFRLISLVIVIYLARYLGTVGFGKYSFVFAYLSFFSVITDLGLTQILVREMSRDPSMAPKLIGNGYIIKLILTAFAIILSLTIITLMACPADTTTYIYIAAFMLLFTSFSDFYTTMFQANLKMKYNVFAKLSFKVLSAILILGIICSHGTLMQVIVVLVLSEMVRTLISYLFSRKFVRPQFDIDFKLLKYLLKESLPIALFSIIFVIYYNIDIVMLASMKGDASVGIYSAAYRLSEPLIFIPQALMISLFPIMSKSFASSKDRLIKSYRLSVKYLLIISIPIVIGTTLIADKIILLIYDVSFVNSVTVLQILIWSLVFASVNSVLLTLLISIDKQKLNMFSVGLCAIVNIVLNFMLIPILSYNGAAIATVITHIVLFIASFYFVSKHLQVLPIHKIIIKPVISSLIMAAFVYHFMYINVFLIVPIAALMYLGILLALRTFSEEDMEIINRIIKIKLF